MLQYTELPSANEIYSLIRKAGLNGKHERYAQNVADKLAGKKLTANGIGLIMRYAILETQAGETEILMDEVFAESVLWARAILWQDREMQAETAEYMRNAKQIASILTGVQDSANDLLSALRRRGYREDPKPTPSMLLKALREHLPGFKEAALLAAIEVDIHLETVKRTKDLGF